MVTSVLPPPSSGDNDTTGWEGCGSGKEGKEGRRQAVRPLREWERRPGRCLPGELSPARPGRGSPLGNFWGARKWNLLTRLSSLTDNHCPRGGVAVVGLGRHWAPSPSPSLSPPRLRTPQGSPPSPERASGSPEQRGAAWEAAWAEAIPETGYQGRNRDRS